MKNKYEIRGEVTLITINSKKYGTKETLIDTVDLPKASSSVGSWFINYAPDNDSFYVTGAIPSINGARKTIHLHRLIMDFPNGLDVDHINHDTLDNRRSVNLREVTKSENQQNKVKAMSNSKSGILGVSWNKKDKRWKAQICVDGIIKFLGNFIDIKEAEIAVTAGRKKNMPFSQDALKAIRGN